MAKLRLLKRFNRLNPGEIVEIARESEARVMKAVGIAEDYVESKIRPRTRVMQPEETQPPTQPEQSQSVPATNIEPEPDKEAEVASAVEEEKEGGGAFGADRYSRRDMNPKE